MNAREKDIDQQRDRHTVIGLFQDVPGARRAIDSLKDYGFPDEKIGVAMRDRAQQEEMRSDTGTKAVEGAASGAVGGGIVGQSLGFFGLDVGLGFDVERLFVVIGFLDLRRGGGSLRCKQRLGRFQRMHLFAAVDDERLLAAHGRVGDDGERNLEGVFEVAQMTALVVEDVERDVGTGAHHQIVGRSLHQDFLDAAQQLQRHRRYRAHMTAAAALRAGLGRALQHAGADALA